MEFAMKSKQFACISLGPQAWKVETDNFFLALNKNNPNKDFPQSIYDRLSEPGRAPNANLTRAFVNTLKGIREGQLEIPEVEKKGIIKFTNNVVSLQQNGGKGPSSASPLTNSSSLSTTLDGSNNKNSIGLNNNNSDDPYVTPEEKKDEEPEQPSNARPRALHPYFAPDSPADGPVYNGPWNEDYLKKGNVVDNMKELENFPFVQLTGFENAAEAYNLASDHWKKVNDEFPMAYLHGVVVALYHSHMNVLEQMSHLEGNNEILQNNNTRLIETVQSLTMRLNDLENAKPAAQILPKKRGKWEK
jgi:hypothetical protein